MRDLTWVSGTRAIARRLISFPAIPPLLFVAGGAASAVTATQWGLWIAFAGLAGYALSGST
ncbi:hypothetical protein GCM10010411_47780 [Actinomadura fulvescens]|uniref:Uncharacterized protein n=1 Tax=Actinomadura fulvescens TaxID=46160 RepID=A0ABP6C9K7_9ACTN